ncbi:MAG: hypothetical protein MMC33_002392 [Icmadophila ericetorum]|nr:hypothetical protein [Icmadophila ericetorum]
MASVDDNNEEAPTSAQPEAKEAVANGKASPSSSQTQVAAEVQSPNDGPASSPSSAIHQNNGSETDLGDTSMSSEACVENPKEPIEDFRWEDLEDRYQKRMQGCEETEAALYEEFQNWMKVSIPKSMISSQQWNSSFKGVRELGISYDLA